MKQIRLGKTEIITCKNGFGALPIQRISFDEAEKIILRAYESGITFFDTARAYTDSEEKLGRALKGIRDKVFIASKTMAEKVEDFWPHLEQTLKNLQTDYIDLYQFHNLPFCPKPGDGTGLYEAMLEAKAQGKVRHIGATNHRLAVAHEIIDSGLYETLQFPFCYLASEEDAALVEKCAEADMGFIAMKAMSGGLITRADAAYAFLDQYDNVLPIWGVQKMEELEEFIDCEKNPPVLDEEMQKFITEERSNLAGEFCRGCGYCMPCPMDIQINNCARTSLMIRRAPTGFWFSDNWKKEMDKIEDCIHCDQCKSKCPYGLDTPSLLVKNLIDYREMISK